MTSLYDFTAKDISGTDRTLSDCKGSVILVVNTASACGLTPQYSGLEALYKKYRSQGLVVLGFPCNQFAGQEPGTEAEIASFCDLKYGVTFPMMSKIDVNGANTDPLYKWLKTEAPGLLGSTQIKWNFTKFLLDRQGRVLERFAPTTAPADLEPAIEKALAAA